MKKKNRDDDQLNQSIRIAELENINRGLLDKNKLLTIQLESQSQFQNATRHQSRSASLNRSRNNLQISKNFHSTTALKGSDHKPTNGRNYDLLHHQINGLQEEIIELNKQNSDRITELEDQLRNNSSPASANQLKTELNENIELINLKRLSKKQSAQISSLQSQLDIAKTEIKQLISNISTISNLKDSLQVELLNEKAEVVKLKTDINSITENTKLLEEQLNDLQIEKATLKEHNENLLHLSLREKSRKESIVDVNTKNHFIKKIKELEENLKQELITKRDYLNKITELEIANVGLKNELSRYQSINSALQLDLENLTVKSKSPQLSNYNIEVKDESIMVNLMVDDDKRQTSHGQNSIDVDEENDSDLKLNYLKNLKELNLCKELLRVQYSINNKYKLEAEELHKLYKQSGTLAESHLDSFQSVLKSYIENLTKILNNLKYDKISSFVDFLNTVIATKAFYTFQDFIHTLDNLFKSQIECFEFLALNVDSYIPSNKKDAVVHAIISQSDKLVQTELDPVKRGSVNSKNEMVNVDSVIPSEPFMVLFKLHIEKAHFSFFSEHLMKSSNNNPEVFLTWNFLDDNEHQAYTPTISVKDGIFDCSCQYEGPWSQFLYQYLKNHGIRIEIHLVQGDISVRIAETTILTSTVLEHPNDNLDFCAEFKNDNIEGNVNGKYLLKCDHSLLTLFG